MGLRRPFLRHHESNGTEFGKHARNHLKFGLGKTRGLMLDVSGPSLEAYPDYRHYFYPNHPPLSALLLAGAFGLFGVSEAVFRATLILLSIAAVLLFRRVAARLLAPPYDLAATAIFAFLPSFAYYSVVTCLQVTALVGVLAAVLLYLRWCETGRRREFAGLVAAIAWACFSSWPGYYVAPALLAAHFRSGKPRGRWVAALLGLNIALFGAYALHLWAAEPRDLDALRQLGEAALTRSSLGGPGLLRYLAGEARELGLMMTFAALALALFWGFSLAKGPRRPPDRLVAALALLGLDEALFARLASAHEYYSYFLCVFVALAAAGGLERLAAALRERPAWLRRGALGACAALFLAQSAWVLGRRLTLEGGYEFYHRLGIAIAETTRPEDKVVILTDDIRFYTPYYADRYSVWYNRNDGRLVTENTGGIVAPFGPEALRAFLRENRQGFRYAVTADRDGIRRHVRVLAGADDALLRKFGVHDDDREFLRELCGPPVERSGFLFWELPRR